mmetsp:Transcript_126681/g.370137  ORF Transcript_126681/g.370137 Transcript_126681/m.370137 type:complete len:252 (-) Transcript_126681:1313-2068(-)
MSRLPELRLALAAASSNLDTSSMLQVSRVAAAARATTSRQPAATTIDLVPATVSRTSTDAGSSWSFGSCPPTHDVHMLMSSPPTSFSPRAAKAEATDSKGATDVSLQSAPGAAWRWKPPEASASRASADRAGAAAGSRSCTMAAMEAAGWRADASTAPRRRGSKASSGWAAKRWSRPSLTLSPQLSQSRGILQSLPKVSRVASLPCRPFSRIASEASLARALATSLRFKTVSRLACLPPKEDITVCNSSRR